MLALVAVFTALAIRDQVSPPTINLRTPDPECDLDYVPNTAREQHVRVALCNCIGFGSKNSALVVEQRHLSEEIPRSQEREDDLLPLGRDHGDLHLPLFDQAEDVAALVRVKDDVVLRVAARFRDRGNGRELALIEIREERKLPEELWLHRGEGDCTPARR